MECQILIVLPISSTIPFPVLIPQVIHFLDLAKGLGIICSTPASRIDFYQLFPSPLKQQISQLIPWFPESWRYDMIIHDPNTKGFVIKFPTSSACFTIVLMVPVFSNKNINLTDEFFSNNWVCINDHGAMLKHIDFLFKEDRRGMSTQLKHLACNNEIESFSQAVRSQHNKAAFKTSGNY